MVPTRVRRGEEPALRDLERALGPRGHDGHIEVVRLREVGWVLQQHLERAAKVIPLDRPLAAPTGTNLAPTQRPSLVVVSVPTLCRRVAP
jgi:hypothetical protein